MAPANFRVWLSGDFALSSNVMIGARLGLVFRTFPGKEPPNDGKTLLAPFHVEARFTYLIGKSALDKKLAPYVFGAFGASEWDAAVEVPVTETGTPGSKTVQAWAIGGPAFVALGGGIRYATSPRVAILFSPVKANVAFGNGSILPSLQPEAGLQAGF